MGQAVATMGYGIALDTSGNVYVTGDSATPPGDFPSTLIADGYDIVVLKLANAVGPTEGTIGTELTINGSDFGTKKGKVLINGIATKIPKDGWGPARSPARSVSHLCQLMWPTRYRLWWIRYPMIVSDTFTVRGVVLDDLPVRSGIYSE